jgi:hypothetical protein
VAGCATVPTGPSVHVMPGPGKTFEQFQADDAGWRQWAAQQIGRSPLETINQNTGVGAAVGTATGKLLGADIGCPEDIGKRDRWHFPLALSVLCRWRPSPGECAYRPKIGSTKKGLKFRSLTPMWYSRRKGKATNSPQFNKREAAMLDVRQEGDP